MENKYYTPEIEEFHVVFDYELQADDNLWYWSNILQDLDLIAKCIKDNRCRVKYLDREDIESLGWSYDHDIEESDGNIYNKDNWMMLHENGKISITYIDPCKNEEVMIKLRTTEVYNITIKNKSELKRLLKQLKL